MDRYLNSYIKKDSDSKIILLSGPRQSGKTTLSKNLFPNNVYLNFDSSEDREFIKKKYWNREMDCILFDELHKMKDWKRWLKGIFDTEGNSPRLIVTGSANMNTFQKVGDSLAGRYFQYRLHPIDLKEGVTFGKMEENEVFKRLMTIGGFPEPFLNGDINFYRRWQKSHLDIILRQDFLDLYSIHSIKSIEILIDLLKPRVGSTVSYSNLARDLAVDPKSIQNWLMMLENIYAVFKVPPYHVNIARSILKEPKFYFYDLGRVMNEASRLENLVACSLLKEIHYLEDAYGYKGNLCYLRTKDGAEIDFLVVLNDKPLLCIEVKTSDDNPSKNFNVFKKSLGPVHGVQLVLNLKKEFDTADGIKIRKLIPYLTELNLKKLYEALFQ